MLQPRTPRPLLRICLDWTERRSHLGGVLGAVLLDRMLAADWVVRAAGHRGLRVTSAGHNGLKQQLGVDIPTDGRTQSVGA